MATRQTYLWLTLCLANILLTGSPQGQTLNPSMGQALKPFLQIETEQGQRTFHIGERIPLHLTLFYAQGVPYLVDREPCGARDCDQPCGERECKDLETIEVQPATGWSDPLASYFAQDFPMSYSGPGPGPPVNPFQEWVDLNEWVRFDKPGDYTVTIASRRVTPPVSSIITLHIVPASPEWQSEKLQWIRSIRDRYSPDWFEAEEDLRYLGTPAAIEEMVSRLRGENPNAAMSQCTICMGIIGLPGAMSEVAIASMNRRIEESDFPISPVFFETMLLLHAGPDSDCGEFLRPSCPYEAALWLKVDSIFSRKRAEARSETLNTLDQVGQYIDDPRVKECMRSLPKRLF